MKVVKILLIITLMSVLVACATTPTPLSTPTGKPELIFDNIDKKQVMNLIMKEALETGWRLKSSSDFNLTFSKAAPDAAFILLGATEIHAKFDFVELDKRVKVFVSGFYISKSGQTLSDGNIQGGGEVDKLLIRIQNVSRLEMK